MKKIALLILLQSYCVSALQFGTKVAPEKFAFHVKISGCGSSKVADNILLTAAHCLFNKTNNKVLEEFAAGNTINVELNNSLLLKLEVLDVYMHPSFINHQDKCGTREYCKDLALLHVRPLKDSSRHWKRTPIAHIAQQLPESAELNIPVTIENLHQHKLNRNKLYQSQAITVLGSGLEQELNSLDDIIQGRIKTKGINRSNLKALKLTNWLVKKELIEFSQKQYTTNQHSRVLLKGDSGSPVLNANGEIIAINSYSNLYTQFSYSSIIIKSHKDSEISEWFLYLLP